MPQDPCGVIGARCPGTPMGFWGSLTGFGSPGGGQSPWLRAPPWRGRGLPHATQGVCSEQWAGVGGTVTPTSPRPPAPCRDLPRSSHVTEAGDMHTRDHPLPLTTGQRQPPDLL